MRRGCGAGPRRVNPAGGPPAVQPPSRRRYNALALLARLRCARFRSQLREEVLRLRKKLIPTSFGLQCGS
jgi:hypothetical protein